MDSYQQIGLLKIQSAQDRSHAVAEEVERVKNRLYTSPGCNRVLEFVGKAAEEIHALLDSEKPLAVSGLLDPAEFEVRLQRIIKIIPVLHRLIGFVEGSDVHRSPGQLIQPLRRYAQSIIPSSDIVVSSKPELNYSIQEIAASLRKLFSDSPLKSTCDLLPQLLFVINLPAVESEQILIHSILSHELGHALYDEKQLADTLLPQIRFRDDLVGSLVKSVSENNKKQLEPPEELWFREQATQQVTERITSWIKELSADAIGIRLFGPCLFFAATNLLSSLSHFDHSSRTHPPTRLRLKLMLMMLKQLYDVDQWAAPLQDHVRPWEEVSGGVIQVRAAFDQITIESINTDEVLQLVISTSALAVSDRNCYSSERFTSDVAALPPLMLKLIPPGELGPLGNEVAVDLVSIINAGWYVHLCHFGDFQRHLHAGTTGTHFGTASKLRELVLKGLEISETRTSWKEARLDSQQRKN